MADVYQQAIDSYTRQQKEQEAFLKQQRDNQVKKLKSQVDSQKNALEKTYQDNARQTYIQKMQAQRDLPQQLAAQGVSGGLSESGNIALNSNYGNLLSEYKKERDSGVADLNAAYTSDVADLDNTYLNNLAQNSSYYGNLIAQQKAAQLQAQEEARQAAISAQLQAQASAARAQQQEETKTAKRLQSYIDSLNTLNGTNTRINYLNAQNVRGNLSSDDVYWLANQFGISNDQYNARLADIAANARPDYMTPGEWQAYISGR